MLRILRISIDLSMHVMLAGCSSGPYEPITGKREMYSVISPTDIISQTDSATAGSDGSYLDAIGGKPLRRSV